MSYLINNQQKLNEIIFAKRNKSYGAYAIRSDYGFTVIKSLGIMLLGFSSVITVAWVFTNRPDGMEKPCPGCQLIEQDTAIYTVTFNQEPEPPAGSDHEKPAPADVEDVPNTSVTVVDSVQETATNHTTEVVTMSNPISNGTLTGIPDAGASTGTGSTGIGPGSSTTTATTTIVDIYQVDTMPEFEGGLAGLKDFIRRNLRYPEIARSQDEQGTVHVKFVVDEHGKVGTVKVMRQVGFGMDEEAARVVSMIPRFKKPAKMNGNPVKVYYTLPIHFSLR